MVHYMQIAMFNAYIVSKTDEQDGDFLAFQRKVLSRLIFCGNNIPHMNRGENLIRLTERHFLSVIPPTVNKPKASKRCHVCYAQGR